MIPDVGGNCSFVKGVHYTFLNWGQTALSRSFIYRISHYTHFPRCLVILSNYVWWIRSVLVSWMTTTLCYIIIPRGSASTISLLTCLDSVDSWTSSSSADTLIPFIFMSIVTPVTTIWWLSYGICLWWSVFPSPSASKAEKSREFGVNMGREDLFAFGAKVMSGYIHWSFPRVEWRRLRGLSRLSGVNMWLTLFIRAYCSESYWFLSTLGRLTFGKNDILTFACSHASFNAFHERF